MEMNGREERDLDRVGREYRTAGKMRIWMGEQQVTVMIQRRKTFWCPLARWRRCAQGVDLRREDLVADYYCDEKPLGDLSLKLSNRGTGH